MENRILHQILGGLNQLQGDVKEMRGDINALKQGQEEINTRLDTLEQGQKEMRKEQVELRTQFNSFEKIARETREGVVLLEADLMPKINLLAETRTDLHPRVQKLESTVEKLKFGSEVIRLVEIFERQTNS
ncbi:MAG: hypothetical protein FWH07_04505 [Oscillospiraceae bacterium]|nr:hypothetical protein [Oscillospiraceae bacterium]